MFDDPNMPAGGGMPPAGGDGSSMPTPPTGGSTPGADQPAGGGDGSGTPPPTDGGTTPPPAGMPPTTGGTPGM